MAVSIDAAYSWAINTCNDETVRYSQTYRNAETRNGYTYYDCSSFIWYALKYGNFDVATAYGQDYPFTTSYMDSTLTKLGFTKITCTSDTQSLAGDILWRSGHTEMAYEGGDGTVRSMGAHSNTGSYATNPDAQVSINSSAVSITNWTYIYRYGDGGATQGYAYSAYAVAAMCGNFWMESHADPSIWEGRTTTATWTDLLVGYGLGQWTNTGGDTNGRLYQLHTYLSENGYADDDGYGQLEFLIYENTWYSRGYASDYNSLDEFLNTTSTDIQALAYAYLQGWEGIWNDTYAERAQMAQTAYEYMLEHAYDDDITDWIVSGNSYYLTEAEYLNNCVIIYRYLCLGSGSGDGGTGKTKKGLKIWQMLPWWYWYR